MITAKHRDGTSVAPGDQVRVEWDNGNKAFGRISAVGKPMRFADMNFAELQTYSVRCTDGRTRPAHARHIKYVRPRTTRR